MKSNNKEIIPESEKPEETDFETVVEMQSGSDKSHSASSKYSSATVTNYKGLARDFEWFYQFLHFILGSIDPKEKKYACPTMPQTGSDCIYDEFLTKNNITNNERIILLLAIIPHFSPTLLNILKGVNYNRLSYPQLGGILVGDEKNFWPTIETALFLISDGNLELRIKHENYFSIENRLIKSNWIVIEESKSEIPICYNRFSVSEELLAIIKGSHFRPDYSSDFPASYLSTKLNWNDLVLPYNTLEELLELKIWLEHGHTILQHPELSKKIKPGYRALFYGPPGTGKTLTASLLGKEFGLDVYRIDLSMLVSKWVGETEKNLKKVFDLAENKDWILFFDEADSIFGKRTQTNSSNDRFANQEVSYLLQRIEDFPGMIILASNLKSNIDEAFNRRFQSIIYYPLPDSDIRLNLWQKAFPHDFILDHDISLPDIANKYELAGGAIINIVRYCVLRTLHRKEQLIRLEDIELGIIKENKKFGKIVT